ncbi:UNVERIFIED_CONTAM: hypothetical protein K2H54_052283 [Gekko kuhli]
MDTILHDVLLCKPHCNESNAFCLIGVYDNKNAWGDAVWLFCPGYQNIVMKMLSDSVFGVMIFPRSPTLKESHPLFWHSWYEPLGKQPFWHLFCGQASDQGGEDQDKEPQITECSVTEG